MKKIRKGYFSKLDCMPKIVKKIELYTSMATLGSTPSMNWGFVFISKLATCQSWDGDGILQLTSTGPYGVRWHPLCHLSGPWFLVTWYRSRRITNSADLLGSLGGPRSSYASCHCHCGGADPLRMAPCSSSWTHVLNHSQWMTFIIIL